MDGLPEVKKWYEKGNGSTVGNGEGIRFWYDVWMDDCPLKITYPKLYMICNKQLLTVAEGMI